MHPVISVDGLSFTYPHAHATALRDVSLAVQPGEIFGLLGPSGAGKSTLQKILIRLLRGFTGSVCVNGRPVGDWGPDFYRQVGVAFEGPTHFGRLTAAENLRYYAALFDLPPIDPAPLLAEVGLEHAVDQRVGAFSKGMKTRLGVIRAFLHDPSLVFLDEPTGGLDPVNVATIGRLIRARADGERTVFLSTHDMNVAEQLCDRVAFIVDGTVAAIDAPRALRLAHGEASVRVEHRLGEGLETSRFPLAGLGDDQEFLNLLRAGRVETLHSEEASLAEVFARVTGRSLR